MELSNKEIVAEFDGLGVSIPEQDMNIFTKLRKILSSYNLDLEGLVDEWVAFQITSNNTKMNVQALEQFQQKLAKAKKPVKIQKVANQTRKVPSSSNVGSSNIDDLVEMVSSDNKDAHDLMTAYSTPVRKGKAKRQLSPEQVNDLTKISNTRVVHSFDQVDAGSPSGKYCTRKNTGEIVASYGNAKRAVWSKENTAKCSIQPHGTKSVLVGKFRHLLEKVADRVAALDSHLESVFDKIKEESDVGNLSPVNASSANEMTVLGRITCDSNGRLNAKSVKLQGDLHISKGVTVAVDLSKLANYSLFPGQVVVFEGLNTTGKMFLPTNIVTNPQQKMAPVPDTLSKLSVVAVSGPYTTSDSLSYEPLADFLKQLQLHPPDVCFMFGPFVDTRMPLIQNLADTTYKHHFHKILEVITTAVEGIPTQIVIVPSSRDAHHSFVYPQPAFELNKIDKQLHFVSDPCTLKLNGLCVGVTSTDVLFHLGAEEISCSPKTVERLSRLIEYLLQQGNYYPLNPPAQDVNISYETYEVRSRMWNTPHLLLLPSDLKYFIKNVNGCFCVNPGRLSKGPTGGTFARLLMQKNELDQLSLDGEVVRI